MIDRQSRHRGPRLLLKIAAGLLAIVGVVGAIIGIVWFSQWSDQQELKGFKGDIVAQGFVLGAPPKGKKTNPYFETEGGERHLEIVVVALDCWVELERDEDETEGKKLVPNGRKIEHYEVDEVNHNGREYEIDDYPGLGVKRTEQRQFMARPHEVEQYLHTAGKTRFPCLKA